MTASETLLSYGDEGLFCLIIDNFHPQPEALVSAALEAPGFISQAQDFYPGRRKIADENYREFVVARATSVLKQHHLLDATRTLAVSLCAYSLATMPETALRPIQCVPHIDTHDSRQFAVVHYLCQEGFGGTSFYRHRSTGFEHINDARLKPYFAQLKQEVMHSQEHHQAYIDGDTELFERVCQVPLKFNRALIYASNQLHSGDLKGKVALSPDPERGRLTVNSFLSAAIV